MVLFLFAGLLTALGDAVTGLILLDNSWLQSLIAGAVGVIFTPFAFIGHEASRRSCSHPRPPTTYRPLEGFGACHVGSLSESRRELHDGTRDQAGEHRGRSGERSACQHIGTLRSPQEISRLGQKLVSKPSASGRGNTGASPTQRRRAVYSNLLKTGKFACHRALKSARSMAAVSS